IPFHAIFNEGGRLSFMQTGRAHGTATTLTTGINAGLILLAGGDNTTQLYNPTPTTINGVAPGRFANGPTMGSYRSFHTATRLSDGWVLIVGGQDASNNNAVASAELYNPANGTIVPVGMNMSIGRFQHTATLVPGPPLLDTVLIAGGQTAWGSPL